MTKSELVEAIAARAKLTKARAEHVVNLVFDAIVRALEKGEHIEIRGFGSFTLREYQGYPGRNPKTGEAVDVRPKKLPFFKVGKELRELVNDSRAFRPPSSGSAPVDADAEEGDDDAE